MQTIVIFPHAGSSRSVYSTLEKEIKAATNNVEVLYIDYSKHYDILSKITFDSLVNSISAQLQASLKPHNNRITLLGHSMGAHVAYAVSQILYNDINIHNLILSDSRPLKYPDYTDIHILSEHAFDDLIDEKYDIPRNIKSVKPLYLYFRNRLKQDLLVLDTISPQEHSSNCSFYNSISIFYSNYTDINTIHVEWTDFFFNKDLDFYYFNGDHYYFATNPKQTAEHISNIIKEKVVI